MAQDSNHDGIRAVLKVLGPVVLVLGLICIGTTIAGFNSDWNSARQEQEAMKREVQGGFGGQFPSFGGNSTVTYVGADGKEVTINPDNPSPQSSPGSSSAPGPGLMFLGMGLLFVGGVMCQYGYMGSVARYEAEEMAPVVTDTVNSVAKGIGPGVASIAHAIKDGMADESAEQIARCHKCGAVNRHDAKFCNSCGAAIAVTCPSCGAANAAGAQFCDACGHTMT